METSLSSGQVIEQFDDGNFTSDPAWVSSTKSGVTGDFAIINGELQSNGPESTNKIWISNNGIPDLNAGTIRWVFDVRYLSPPSGSNNIKVFLLSSVADLETSPEGYFIALGESGSDDGIDLMKTGSNLPIISDPEPSISSGINMTIEVIRDGNGLWSLSSGANKDSLTFIGSATDNQFTHSGYFGFLVSHTKSRNQDFYFDNIAVSVTDNSPPKISEVIVEDQNNVQVIFSEPLSEGSASKRENYSINDAIPVSIQLEPSHQAVNLVLTASLDNGSNNTLVIKDLADISGNSTAGDTAKFLYFQPSTTSYKDVIVTEILADPTPPNDLPEVEFIELYNRSDKIFDLLNWTFCDATQCSALPSLLLFPDQYVVLCDIVDISEFNTSQGIIGLNNWPTLNNAGDNLKIVDNNGLTVDIVDYSNQWFNSSSKREGGWSLELIDTKNLCSDENNWIGAMDNTGGTPGLENSVNSIQPDLSGPEITQVFGASSDTIVVIFNEALKSKSISSAMFDISPEVDIKESFYDPGSRSLNIVLSEPLLFDITYYISVRNITDCSGNPISNEVEARAFHVLKAPEPGDLIINELLFNPKSNGTDFVEVFNKSNKHLDLSKLYIGNFDFIQGTENIVISNGGVVTNQARSIAPNEYLVLTGDPLVLSEQHPSADPSRSILVNNFPGMPDQSGSVVLFTNGEITIDKFEYTADFHSLLLNNLEGVSLERISFDQPTQDANNWTSASSDVQYATPGVENSQLRIPGTSDLDNIEVSPKIIDISDSPQSFATISYNFSQLGGIANVKVFDISGRLIYTIAENERLGLNGFFKWEGVDERGKRARTGYYIIYFEVFYADGKTISFKDKVAVTE